MKYDWNDVSIVPETLSTIASRKEINPLSNGRLPLFTAPMDKVIDETNVKSIRPSYGIHTKHFWDILGKKVNQDIKFGISAHTSKFYKL